MKTHTIKTPTAELMVVELPENIESDYYLIYGRNPEETYLSFRKNAEFKPPRKSEKLENGIWMVLGKPDEISEEDIEQLVEWGDADPSGDRFIIGYRSYFDGYKNDVPQFTCKTPTESLLSLLESEIYWNANPFSYPNERHTKDGINVGVDIDAAEAFHEADQKTFDRSRTLIFKKNKGI